LVHTNGFKMHILGAWAVAGQAPLIAHIHDYLTPRPLAGRIVKLGVRHCGAFATNSKSVAEDARRLLGPAKTITTIHNAVDPDRFTPEGPRADLDSLCGMPPATPDVIRVGLMATFAHWKGHRTFLRAVSLLPGNLPVRAHVIGGPIYQTRGSQHTLEELQQEAKALGVSAKVGFTGFLKDPAPALRALDIVIHASSAPEPFGMVIIEAMACARAVVASRGGGAVEIFEDGVTALGHQPGDANELARQIARLVVDPALRSRMGASGRQAVLERFHPQRMALEFAALYCSTRETFLMNSQPRRGVDLSPSRDGAAS
jgi:glycosyltransferase involved in cell wall biosynthesis